MVTWSIALMGNLPLRQYVELALRAEELGFDQVLVYDDLMFKAVWPILTLIGANTKRVRVGPCVTHPFYRHPAITAANIAALDELTGGRAVLGIGRGDFHDLVGISTKKSVVAVKEAIQMIRRLLSGDRSPFEGKVFKAVEGASLQFEPVRREIPIIVGTRGRRLCQIAGELADEVNADGLWNPDYLPILKENLAIGAKRAGRDPASIGIGVCPPSSVSLDREAARKAARMALGVYLPYLGPITEFSGISASEIEQVRLAAMKGSFEEAARHVSDLAVANCSITGTPDDVVRQCRRMLEAGLTHVAFGPPHGPDPGEAIRLVGERVIPEFRK